MAKEIAGPGDVAKVIEKLIADGMKISNYTAESKQDGLHVSVQVVVPWIEVSKT